MSRYFSNSELGTYRRCQRRWYLGYVLKLESARERLIPPRLRGNLVHQALALYYEESEDPITFLHAESERLRAEYKDKVEIIDLDELKELNKVLDLALAMVEGYVEWVKETGVDQDLEFLGSEVELSYDLGNKRDDLAGVHIIGKLDERVRRISDDFSAFFDHKTVGDLTQFPRFAQIDTQLLHYNVLYRLCEIDDRPMDGGIFNMLRTVKRTARSNPPYYDRWPVQHNKHQLNNYYRKMVALILEMLQKEQLLADGGDHQTLCPPTPDQTCAWQCTFFPLCPLMDDGSDWEGLIEAAYREHDPIERYISIEKG